MLSAILKRCMAASRCQGTIRFWKGQELSELTAMFTLKLLKTAVKPSSQLRKRRASFRLKRPAFKHQHVNIVWAQLWLLKSVALADARSHFGVRPKAQAVNLPEQDHRTDMIVLTSSSSVSSAIHRTGMGADSSAVRR